MRFITAATAATFLAREAYAHPASLPSTNAIQRRVVNLDAYRLTTIPAYSNATVATTSDASISLLKRANYIDTATALVKKLAPGATYRLADDHYIGENGIAHVNFKQTAHGLDIDNADFNINVSKVNLTHDNTC